MRSHKWAVLFEKELGELLASRAYWLLLLMIGPLVGHAFIIAVNSYAEASGMGGGPAALAQGLSPLDGILVPTFGAYDLAVTLLFPFVAIRMVAAERENGAWKLLLQGPAGVMEMLSAKAAALLAGWLVAWIAGLLTLLLWKIYGGSLYGPEVWNLLLGHLLRVFLASGIAVAAAGISNNASSAAIATLGFTVGTWALDFVAAGRGLAAYTPVAALRVFEQGQLRLSIVAVLVILGLAGFVLAAVWLRPGRRLAKSAVVVGVAVSMAWPASFVKATWDVSENRRNSFPAAEEEALRRIHEPLRIEVNLAPEDPRLTDLERSILSKLARILPSVQVVYVAQSSTGLFESNGQHYGEVWYEMGGRRVMSRSTTEAIVLQTLFELAGMTVPKGREESGYGGHPLRARPAGAAWLFYISWPALVSLALVYRFRERN